MRFPVARKNSSWLNCLSPRESRHLGRCLPASGWSGPSTRSDVEAPRARACQCTLRFAVIRPKPGIHNIRADREHHILYESHDPDVLIFWSRLLRGAVCESELGGICNWQRFNMIIDPARIPHCIRAEESLRLGVADTGSFHRRALV